VRGVGRLWGEMGLPMFGLRVMVLQRSRVLGLAVSVLHGLVRWEVRRGVLKALGRRLGRLFGFVLVARQMRLDGREYAGTYRPSPRS